MVGESQSQITLTEHFFKVRYPRHSGMDRHEGRLGSIVSCI